jgi:hypothetical protein
VVAVTVCFTDPDDEAADVSFRLRYRLQQFAPGDAPASATTPPPG